MRGIKGGKTHRGSRSEAKSLDGPHMFVIRMKEASRSFFSPNVKIIASTEPFSFLPILPPVLNFPHYWEKRERDEGRGLSIGEMSWDGINLPSVIAFGNRERERVLSKWDEAKSARKSSVPEIHPRD